MLQNNELIALLFAILVICLLIVFRKHVRAIPLVNLLLYSFGALCLALLCTIFEGYFWYSAFNLLEHVFNMASTALLVYWLWVLSKPDAGAQ